MRSPAFLAVLTALAIMSAGPAPAQTRVTAGQTVTASFTNGGGHCYALDTTVGSLWTIDLVAAGLDPVLNLGRGQACNGMQTDLVNDDINLLLLNKNSRISFASGGGTYLIATGALFAGSGGYRLSITQRPGVATRRLLPAGPTVATFATDNSSATASTSAGPTAAGMMPGPIIKDCADVCPELVVLPAGSFTMGSPADEEGRDPDEGPRRTVTFGSPFAMGKYEVTFAEYDACVADGGCDYRPNDQGWGRGRRPVLDVSWNDAQFYVAWLSRKTGQRYFLPSEAEWEFAARAGSTSRWNTGDAIISDDANFNGALGRTVPVGGFPANAFGLFDTHGNVFEWVLDCDEVGYFGAPTDGAPALSGNCDNRIIRGGDYTSPPQMARSALRGRGVALTRRGLVLGFRVARAL